MNNKKKLYSLTILTTLLCVSSPFAQEDSPRCVQSKHALKDLEMKVFDEIDLKISKKSLRELEENKVKLEARKSILDTFSNIHKKREEFEKRLNPTNPNSFYSKSMNAKTAVQETQKQIISNYILSSITSSISAILEKDNFLETKNQEILESSEWKTADSSYKKFSILSKGNPYDYIKTRCEELNLKNNSEDPCTNFTDIKEKSVLTFFTQTNQDMVSDVTNNFFKAYATANKGEDNLDSKLKKIQTEQITDYINVDDLNKERTILISSLLEDDSSEGIFDRGSISNFYKVNSIDAQENVFSQNPLKSRTPSANETKSLESIQDVERDFEAAKKCFTKKAFGIDIRCKSNQSISHFFNKIDELGFSKANQKENGTPIESQLLANKDVQKFNAKELISNIAKDELNTLAMLRNTSSDKKNTPDQEKYREMRQICKSLVPLASSDFAESLWSCIDKLNSSSDLENEIADKKTSIDIDLVQVNKELELARESVNNKYGDLVKYAAATAKEYCQSPSNKYLQSCVGSENNVTKLVFGDESFLTNLNNIEWNLSGKKDTEEILGNVNSKCTPLLNLERQKSLAEKQTNKEKKISETSSLKNLCHFASNDLKNLKKRTPTQKQISFRRNYNSSYDRATGKMKHTAKTGIGSMIASSAGKALLNTGLPLYLQNSTFKNTLPYQTNMAMYQKNYMYMMSNPQYWSTNMFTGYGVSSYSNGYSAGTSYYNFSN